MPLSVYRVILFILVFKSVLQVGKSVDITESSAGCLVLDSRSRILFLLYNLLCLALSVFESAAVREDDAVSVLVEFNYLELEFFAKLCFASVFLNKVLWSSETFNAFSKLDYRTSFELLDNLACVN